MRRIEHASGNQARFAQGKEYASNEKAKIDEMKEMRLNGGAGAIAVSR
jgi:hypothetical protein